MSTLRYSGEIRIRVTYLDGSLTTAPRYRCFLRGPGDLTATIIVNAPAYLSHAVDSPEAFDDAAHAALSFAENDDRDWSVHAHAAFKADGTGWHVGRTPSAAWPKVENKTQSANVETSKGE